MNERIFELAEQAEHYAITRHPVSNIALSVNSENFVKKFTELIVEECRYVMDCNKGSDQHSEWNRALFETSVKIKDHFGVEE